VTLEDAAVRELPDGFELDDDRLVSLNSGARSSLVAGALLCKLMAHCDAESLGWCFPAGTVFWLFRSRRTARRPDASFVRFGRFQNEQLPEGDAELAPDLAVEVIAPGDLIEEMDWKLDDYFRAGVRLVWVINPATLTALVYRKEGAMARLRDGDELDGEQVVPGFRCPLSDLWPENRFVAKSSHVERE
jgi:Uma2 family endonuclease